MSTVRAKRKFMHSTSSPAASLCFIELPASSAIDSSPGAPPPPPRLSKTEGSWLQLAAGDGVEIAGAFRQPVLVPSPPAIQRAEDLPEAGNAVNLVRVARMHRHRHHRRLGLDAMVEAPPGQANIVGAVDRSVGAARRRAEAGIHDLGVMRGDADVATVGQWREPADLHVLPGLAAVVAAEKAHAVGEKDSAGCGTADGESMAVQHTLDLGLAADPAAVFGLLAEADQIGGDVFPGLAPIAAAHHAVGLERRINIVRGIGVAGEPHDPAWEGHDDAVMRQSRIGHLAPSIAAILAAIDAGRRGTGIQDARVLRMDADRPDVGVPVGQVQPFPTTTAIRAP